MEIFAYVMSAAVGLPCLVHLVRRFRARHEPARPQGTINDAYEAAFLSAGPGRVADTVLAVLASDGRIEIRDPGIVSVREFAPRHPVEAGFLEAFRTTPTSSLYWLRIAVMRSAAVQALGDALADRGLARRPTDPNPPSRPGLPLSVIGLVLCVGALVEPFAAVPLAVFGLIALLVVIGTPHLRITTEGRAALARYRRIHESSTDLAVRVALHGRTQIPDRALYLRLTNSTGPGARYQASSTSTDPGPVLFATTVSWCGGGSGHSACGGSSCGSSSGDSGWSSGGGCSSGSSSCGGGSSSSCGSSSGGSSCGGGGGSSCGSSS
ncbi:TIGR04222 domain-containing membrane protein [Streptomyces sp. TRM66268-LWL]|uniref:TIGR04222 domain-containing membrane protein n=1 Tax=Streptomyces polyasparticus TaxID=2767826 RepID=A0ABR7SDP8_9ACTN|nr:TIGR04222 domain-containing membrane protein [Streptomyces polyasparticus]MBC9713099.1 TIGR04222 domain-containing membrane protein [Streptomyces polyasparticus]